ncbi:MAG: transcription elongation factor GreA [Candidatus Cloacimonadota bacterium]
MDLRLFITAIGMDKIQRRIAHLMHEERPLVITSLATAREFGDLSENAEYKAARESQRAIDSEIDYLRRKAAQLKVIDTAAIPKDLIRFGAYCQTRDTDTGEETCYHIVGVEELKFSDEENVMPISVVSPIGQGLLGKKVGDIALISAPMGERKLEVIEIR